MTLLHDPSPTRTLTANADPGQIPPWLRRKRVWVLMGLGLGLLLILVLLGAPPPQEGSTYSRSLTGYRSWYDYARQQELPIQRWQRPYSELAGTGHTLIQVWRNQPAKPLGREDIYQIQDWVKQGNRLILLSWENPYCSFERCPQGDVTTAPFSSQLDHAGQTVRIQTTRRHQLKSGDRPELKDAYGSVVWSHVQGEGTITYATYPWIGANIFVDQPGNYRFLAELAQGSGGKIWIDEWIHGHRDPPPPNAAPEPSPPEDVFSYLNRTPVALLAAQMVLLLLLLIWGHNHRFGAVQQAKAPVQNNSEQYIQALGAILNQADQTGFVLSQLRDILRHTLASQLGLTQSYGTRDLLPPDPDLAHQWAAMTGRPAQKLLELLEQAGQTQPLSDRQLLDWVSQAESILRGSP